MSDDKRDYEAEARAQGWAGEENWRGDPDKFKTAEQFVKDGENIPAILKSRIERGEQAQADLKKTTDEFRKFMTDALERTKAEKKKAIADLKAIQKQAVTDGDGEAFDEADKKIEELKVEPEAPSNQLDPAASAWLNDNAWYETNAKLGAFADGLADRLIAQGIAPMSPAYFQELSKQTREAFPDEFRNKNRDRANATDGGSPAVDSSKRSFDDLPDDAKASYARFAKDMPDFKKEDFVANYDWE